MTARLWPTSLPISTREGDGLPSAHQVEQALRAMAGPVGILAGSPGTGKTHTLAFILREVIAVVGIQSVAVVAPTGKAAVRASQSLALQGLNLRATTIHRRLGIGKNGHASGRGSSADDWGFIFNSSNPLPIRVLVVDESSMISTDLMASLLDACADGTHVLFIGDPYQLPPVGHGAPLRDMIAAGIPYGELTHVRRNAGQIVHACLRIKNGESFETASAVDLDGGKNLLMVETPSEEESVKRLLGILGNARKFHPVLQTQVIVGLNKRGALSRVTLNNALHGLLNPDGYSVAGNPFKVGDKIICLRNSRMHTVEPIAAFSRATPEMAWEPGNYQVLRDDEGEPVESYVANGEIGFVVAISASLTIARIGEDDSLIKIPMGKPSGRGSAENGGNDDGDATADENGRDDDSNAERGRQSHFDLAYVVTVHKAQGSESPCVIVMIDPRAGMIANREWVYTAISRASKLCVLIGSKAVLDKQRLKQSTVRRKTFLQELIAEAQKA